MVLKVISFRDGFRKIGIMKKADSRTMCAQCHVEYARKRRSRRRCVSRFFTAR